MDQLIVGSIPRLSKNLVAVVAPVRVGVGPTGNRPRIGISGQIGIRAIQQSAAGLSLNTYLNARVNHEDHKGGQQAPPHVFLIIFPHGPKPATIQSNLSLHRPSAPFLNSVLPTAGPLEKGAMAGAKPPGSIKLYITRQTDWQNYFSSISTFLSRARAMPSGSPRASKSSTHSLERILHSP